MRAHHRGFTLLETLVAVAIFAVLGGAAYQVLDATLQSDERLAMRSDELRALNRALLQIQRDVEQLAERGERTSAGIRPYLEVSATAQLPLQFTRGGRANPLALPRSSLQRVAYAVNRHPDSEDPDSPHYRSDQTYLLRYVWPVLDDGRPESALVQVLLADVESMAVTVQSEQGAHPSWPPKQVDAGAAPERPRLIEVKLEHGRWGPIQRRLPVL